MISSKNMESCLFTDEQIIDDIRNGNHSMLGLLYQRYYMKVFHRIIEFIKDKDEAHDLAQDIFLKTFNHLNDFQGRSKFSTWLYSIAYNHCMEHLRKKKRNEFVNLDNAIHVAEENEEIEQLAILTYMDHLLRNTDSLSEAEKQMLVLKYQENHSIKNLQEKFNLTASATKMRLKRAKSKLLEAYNKTKNEPPHIILEHKMR
jgi:RNA polymerase sigma-70 factor (ECF subfamily)